jgi:subtilisin family serine protease
MYRFLLFLFVFAAYQLRAQNVAVFFCQEVSQKDAVVFAETHHLELVSFLKYENVLLAKGTLSSAENVCFVSEWKNKDNQVAFARNEIIVRLQTNGLQDFNNYIRDNSFTKVKQHDFIPNQFTIYNVAEDEDALKQIASDLKQKKFVKASQVNFVHTLQATSVDDPLFERQWSIKNTGSVLQGNGTPGADMNVDSAWSITTGGVDIKIAILDSGVDTLHEDLAANMLSGFDGFANDSLDTKGYPTPNFSSDAHGTACAGIAAAAGDNGLGVAGIAYTSKIIPIRIFYYQDYGGGIGVQPTTNTDALLSGSAFAWRVANADVMSTSAGLSPIFIFFLGIDTDVVNDEIEEAFNSGRGGKGVPMFFSAGNDDIDDVLWPANLPATIAVGASSMCDERKSPDDCSTESWGSTFGTNLDFVAPGTLIASTDITGALGYSATNYTFSFNGTSAACPNAAGVGALILSVKPNLHARDVKAVMNLTAKKIAGYDFDEQLEYGSWNTEVGYGRVDAYQALLKAQTYQSTVAVNTPEFYHAWTIYPNPSNGLMIFNLGDLNQADVSVFSADGKKVWEAKVNNGGQYNHNLQSGVYFVRIIAESGMVSDTKRIIVR